ncbi:hypothetical protein HAALTHF_43060n [Vreelandella aquamarina]|nr:hypothetical protein HAALTHF_43060n [Halomonas axialensis]
MRQFNAHIPLVAPTAKGNGFNPRPFQRGKKPARRSRLTESSGMASNQAMRRVEPSITERVSA